MVLTIRGPAVTLKFIPCSAEKARSGQIRVCPAPFPGAKPNQSYHAKKNFDTEIDNHSESVIAVGYHLFPSSKMSFDTLWYPHKVIPYREGSALTIVTLNIVISAKHFLLRYWLGLSSNSIWYTLIGRSSKTFCSGNPPWCWGMGNELQFWDLDQFPITSPWLFSSSSWKFEEI